MSACLVAVSTLARRRWCPFVFAAALGCGLSGCQSGPPAQPDLQPALQKVAKSGYVADHPYATAERSEVWSYDGGRLDVSFIAPSAGGTGGFPLIVYLPGLGESASSGGLWRRAWAQAGYAVLAVQPQELTQQVWASPMALEGDFEALAKKEYSAQSAARRIDVLKFALGELQRQASSGNPLYRSVDLSRIALAGFDLGGQTVSLFAGGIASGPGARAHDARLRAAIILSPFPARSDRAAAAHWAALSLPVLSITGTADGDPLGLVGEPALRQDPWKMMPPGGKYLLVLTGGSHEVLAGDGLVNPESQRQSGQGDHASRSATRQRRRGGSGQPGGGAGDELNMTDSSDRPLRLVDASSTSETHRGGRSSRGDAGARGYDLRHVAAIEDVSTAFLDASIKSDARARKWLAEEAVPWLRGSAVLRAK
jgi:predicted dienelactone hydrolase